MTIEKLLQCYIDNHISGVFPNETPNQPPLRPIARWAASISYRLILHPRDGPRKHHPRIHFVSSFLALQHPSSAHHHNLHYLKSESVWGSSFSPSSDCFLSTSQTTATTVALASLLSAVSMTSRTLRAPPISQAGAYARR